MKINEILKLESKYRQLEKKYEDLQRKDERAQMKRRRQAEGGRAKKAQKAENAKIDR